MGKMCLVWISFMFISTCFYAPTIFNGGWDGELIVSPLSVCTSVPPDRPSVHPVRNTNGFCAISFEKIGVLD